MLGHSSSQPLSSSVAANGGCCTAMSEFAATHPVDRASAATSAVWKKATTIRGRSCCGRARRGARGEGEPMRGVDGHTREVQEAGENVLKRRRRDSRKQTLFFARSQQRVLQTRRDDDIAVAGLQRGSAGHYTLLRFLALHQTLFALTFAPSQEKPLHSMSAESLRSQNRRGIRCLSLCSRAQVQQALFESHDP